MLLDFNFSETMTNITITVYIPPRATEVPQIGLPEPDVLSISGHRFPLYKPVHSPVVHRTEYYVEAIFDKEYPGYWRTIDGSASSHDPETESTAHPPCSSSSEIEMEDSGKTEDLKEGTEGLFEVLQRIYENSSEDVRNAMNKSLFESNGTVLSTDWNKVKDGPVKPVYEEKKDEAK